MTGLLLESLQVWAPGGGRPLLCDVSLHVAPGEMLALVGASGAGKTLLLRAASGLLPEGWRLSGRVELEAQDRSRADAAAWALLRGRVVVPMLALPQAGLSPVRSIGAQIADSLRLAGRTANRKAVEAELASVGLEPRVAASNAAALSGGMAQRVALMRALATGAGVVLADEPTSALDGPSARQVIDLLAAARDAGRAVLLVTHDPALAATVADRMAVLHDGRILEQGSAAAVLAHPKHPQVRSMMAALPSKARSMGDLVPGRQSGGGTAPPSKAAATAAPAPVLALRGAAHRAAGGGVLAPVDLALQAGVCIALCGRSGAGKTTLARLTAVLVQATEGTIELEGQPLGRPSPARFATDPRRRLIQMAFQDPAVGFFPGLACRTAINEGLARFGLPAASVDRHARALGLDTALLDRSPMALSQGQLARAGLVRAFAMAPRLLVLDEPTALLDTMHQAQVLHAIDSVRRQGTAVLLVTHDLHVARLLAQEIRVIEDGRIVEDGAVDRVLGHPVHPAARALVAAMP